MSTLTIGITGHRNLDSRQEAQIKPILVAAMHEIVDAVQKSNATYTVVALTALAEGADTLFADAAQALQLPVKVVLPFEKEEYLKTFSSDETRARFEKIYNTTADKTCLNTYDRDNMDQLYLEVGQEVANASDFLFAIWNEKEAKGKGGTAEIVAYAMEKGKKVLVINPEVVPPYVKHM